MTWKVWAERRVRRAARRHCWDRVPSDCTPRRPPSDDRTVPSRHSPSVNTSTSHTQSLSSQGFSKLLKTYLFGWRSRR